MKKIEKLILVLKIIWLYWSLNLKMVKTSSNITRTCEYSLHGNRLNMTGVPNLTDYDSGLNWSPCGNACYGHISDCCGTTVIYQTPNMTTTICRPLTLWNETIVSSYDIQHERWTLISKNNNYTVTFLLSCGSYGEGTVINSVSQSDNNQWIMEAESPEFCCTNCPTNYYIKLLLYTILIMIGGVVIFVAVLFTIFANDSEIESFASKLLLSKSTDNRTVAGLKVISHLVAYIWSILYLIEFQGITHKDYYDSIGIAYIILVGFHSVHVLLLIGRMFYHGKEAEGWELPNKTMQFFVFPVHLAQGLLQLFAAQNITVIAFWSALNNVASPFMVLPYWKLYIFVPISFAYFIFFQSWYMFLFALGPAIIVLYCGQCIIEEFSERLGFAAITFSIACWTQLFITNTWILFVIPQRLNPYSQLYVSFWILEVILSFGSIVILFVIFYILFHTFACFATVLVAIGNFFCCCLRYSLTNPNSNQKRRVDKTPFLYEF